MTSPLLPSVRTELGKNGFICAETPKTFFASSDSSYLNSRQANPVAALSNKRVL
jgi:hypothetical protein